MKYIGYYDTRESDENRNYVLAAVNKMDYIINTIICLGYDVEIVSASETRNAKGYEGREILLGNGKKLKLFRTIGRTNKLTCILNRLITKLDFFFYLLFKIQRNEIVLVYHSLGYVNTILFLKKIKKFQLILEVEEIYADVTGREGDRKKEWRLFEEADAYIFPTELLDEKINIINKPSITIYGTYQVEEQRTNLEIKGFVKEKKHILYAGTFDPRKGVAQAVAAAEYLPPEYHVHILGFGTKEETEHIKDVICKYSRKECATVTYDGLLSGEEYIQFVQNCQVGLSTQSPDAAFNETSFPSKVLSYLSNGLHVVSVRIKALECSAINELLHYYDESTSESIAAAIKRIDFSEKYDSRKVVRRLDEQFTNDLDALIHLLLLE